VRSNHHVGRLVGIFVVAFLFSPMATAASAQGSCVAPQFTVGQSIEESEEFVLLAVSLRPIDFTRARLICLAKQFRTTYRKSEQITVHMFSSLQAARDYSIARGDEAPAVYRRYDPYSNTIRQLHATYVFSRSHSEEYVTIRPLGSDLVGAFDTRIDLPVKSLPECMHAVKRRCPVALDEIQYPIDSLLAGHTASVEVTATIATSGSVGNIKVRNVVSSEDKAREKFVREAIENLETWRFEAMPRMDSLRITYSFSIEGPTGPRGGNVAVRLSLPDRVLIMGGAR